MFIVTPSYTPHPHQMRNVLVGDDATTQPGGHIDFVFHVAQRGFHHTPSARRSNERKDIARNNRIGVVVVVAAIAVDATANAVVAAIAASASCCFL